MVSWGCIIVIVIGEGWREIRWGGCFWVCREGRVSGNRWGVMRGFG